MQHYFKMIFLQTLEKKKCSVSDVLPNRVRIIAWVNIILQLVLPLSLSFTPAIAAAPTSKTATINVSTEPYIIGIGENIGTVAKKHGITVDELKQINIYRTYSKPFNKLTSGDEIDVPRKISPFSIDNQKNKNADVPLENKLAGHAQTGAVALAAGNVAKSAERMVRSAVNNEFNSQAQDWLSQFGTTRAQLNINENNKLDGSTVDVLVPLYDNQKSLLFTQLGVRNKDSRNTVNIGAGVRTFQNNWMVGTNIFFDNDITGKNRRVGVGAEAWTDYLKLSVNSYFGITNWHQSRDFADYNERPANGYDVRADAYLPAHPQLGGTLMYEKYRGDEVALFGKDNRQKNPHAVTAGVNYTPIPLLTVGAEHRAGQGSKNDSSINIQLNYRLGESLQSHFSPSAVALNRTLAGSRYDLVERNNNIVLDYQKQDLIQLALPGQITGGARDTVKVDAQVTTKYGLKRIDWDTASLTAAGGEVTQVSSQSISIKLPPYTVDSNRYILGAVAYDNKGNISNRGTTQIIITQQVVDKLNSTLQVSHAEMPADGVSVSLITLNLKDANNLPVQGVSEQLTLDLHFTPDVTVVSSGSHPMLSSVTETAPGIYLYRLTAGLAQGNVIITPTINDIYLTSAKVILTESSHALSPENSLFRVEPAVIIANGEQSSTLSFTAQDSNHNPIKGLMVAFDVSGLPEVTLSEVTENNGVYSAILSGIVAGTVTVIPTVNGTAVADRSHEIILTADHSTVTIDLVVMNNDAFANGVDTNKVEARVTDSRGNPLESVAVEFSADNGATIMLPSAITNHDGIATVTLTNLNVGVTTVTAMTGDHQRHIETSFIPETPEALLIYRNGIELTEYPVVGDNLVAVAMCSIALCRQASMNYQWEVESLVGSGVFMAIPGATSETLAVTGDLQKRAIRVTLH